MNLGRRCVLVGAIAATGAGAIGSAAGATADPAQHKAGLVTLCSSDAIVRVGALNDAPVDVVVPANVLQPNASAELRALFPLTIPAGTRYQVTFDLPAGFHGSWTPRAWKDPNGVLFKSTGGTAAPNGTTCADPTTDTSSSTTTTTTTLAPPSPEPQPAPVTATSTSNSRSAHLAIDGNPSTAWTTQMRDGTPPTWAWLRLDLGSVRHVDALRWMFSTPSLIVGEVTLQASSDGRAWTDLGELTVGSPLEWQEQPLDVNARYLRLYARNNLGIAQLGFVAEAAVLASDPTGPGVGGTSATADAASPDVTESGRYRPVGSRRSSNSPDQSSRLPLDGDRSTAWSTSMSVAPAMGWTGYDLGDTVPLGRIRWMFATTDQADAYRVQVSNDLATWTTLGEYGNPAAADEWIELALTDVDARFVRWIFTNPNGDTDIGGLSEVRFYAPSAD